MVIESVDNIQLSSAMCMCYNSSDDCTYVFPGEYNNTVKVLGRAQKDIYSIENVNKTHWKSLDGFICMDIFWVQLFAPEVNHYLSAPEFVNLS